MNCTSAVDRMWIARNIPWDGTFPYAILDRFGITPNSTNAEVQDAAFALGSDMNNEEVNISWERIRLPRRRIHFDLFCPDLPQPKTLATAQLPKEQLQSSAVAAIEMIAGNCPERAATRKKKKKVQFRRFLGDSPPVRVSLSEATSDSREEE